MDPTTKILIINKLSEIEGQIIGIRLLLDNDQETPDDDQELRPFIDSFFIPDFLKLESSLGAEGYFNSDRKWISDRKDLINLLYALMGAGYFIKFHNGIWYKPHHYRHFLEKRYGLPHLSLTNISRKHKPDFKTAQAVFYWHKFEPFMHNFGHK